MITLKAFEKSANLLLFSLVMYTSLVLYCGAFVIYTNERNPILIFT